MPPSRGRSLCSTPRLRLAREQAALEAAAGFEPAMAHCVIARGSSDIDKRVARQWHTSHDADLP